MRIQSLLLAALLLIAGCSGGGGDDAVGISGLDGESGAESDAGPGSENSIVIPGPNPGSGVDTGGGADGGGGSGEGGGSDSGSGSGSDSGNGGVDDGNVVIDTMDRFDQDEDEPKVFTSSRMSSSQIASMFELEYEASLASIQWTGITTGNINLETTVFMLQIFRGELLPQDPMLLDRWATVTATPVGLGVYDYINSDIYLFEYQVPLDRPIVLAPGRYWIAVLDPYVSGIDFSWARGLRDSPNTSATGSASRGRPEDAWTGSYGGSSGVGGPGYSLRIEIAP